MPFHVVHEGVAARGGNNRAGHTAKDLSVHEGVAARGGNNTRFVTLGAM